MNYDKYKHTIKIYQHFTLIYNCAGKCYERTNLIIENIFLSSLISLRNGFVLGTNIWISIFK